MSALRIVSLLPSATEVVAALGLQDCLVGRSHECDVPAGVERLPILSAPRIATGGTAREIDARVRKVLADGLSMYVVDAERLWALQPDFILTQTQCAVCAVTPGDITEALHRWPDPARQPRVVSLAPDALADVWRGMLEVGEVLGVAKVAERVVGAMASRLADLRRRTAALPHPRVLTLEWTQPLMAAGNWMPELIEAAGGISLLAVAGQHSPCVNWDMLAMADPDAIIITPCGFEIADGAAELALLAELPEWTTLRAVEAGCVYLVDGSHYFNRPGPRLVESAEIVAEILHPGVFDFGHHGCAWLRADECAATVA